MGEFAGVQTASGVSPPDIRAFVVYNGELIAAGAFSAADSQIANGIARWDGTAWQPLGSGFNGTINALCVYNGALVAGGTFTSAGGQAASNIASWNGSAWAAIGGGISGTSATVNALTVYQSRLFAGGSFTTAGAAAASGIAFWNGVEWTSPGIGLIASLSGARVDAFLKFQGNLIVAGRFDAVGSVAAPNIAAWNGLSWSSIGGLPGSNNFSPGEVYSLGTFGASLVAGGQSIVAAGGQPVNNIASWDGASWTALGDGVPGTFAFVYALAEFQGQLAAAGSFSLAGSAAAESVARWDGAQWSSCAEGTNNSVVRLDSYGGQLIAGGSFITINGVPASGIAQWDGAAWSPMGQGLSSTTYTGTGESGAFALAHYHGDLFAGGVFNLADGAPAIGIARWDGAGWHAVGSGFVGLAYTLCVFNDELVVGGLVTSINGQNPRGIARWNGASWQPLGGGLGTSGARTYASTVYNNALIVAGAFTIAGMPGGVNIARWDGSVWSALGSGVSGPINSLCVFNGDLFAGGSFSAAGGQPATGIARWDGAAWHALGTSGAPGTFTCKSVAALAVRDGELVVSGVFSVSSLAQSVRVARWNGATWRIDPRDIPFVDSFSFHDEWVVAGSVDRAHGPVSEELSRYSATGIPWIAYQPGGITAAPGDTVGLSAAPATDYGEVSFQWYHEGSPLSNGPGGASPGGGTVTGASGTIMTDGANLALTITGVTPGDAGDYTVVFSNSCGQVESTAAYIAIPPKCKGDVNGDGVVNTYDLAPVLSNFGRTVPPYTRGDINGDGMVDMFDLAGLVAVFGTSCG